MTLSPHVVRLRPAPHCRTSIVSYSLKIKPSIHFVNWQQDPFGNYQARLVIPKPTDLLEVEVDLVAELTVVNPFDFFLEVGTEVLPWRYPPELRRELAPYLETLPLGPLLAQQVEHARSAYARPGRRTVDVLVDINGRVHDLLRYDIRMEPGVLTPSRRWRENTARVAISRGCFASCCATSDSRPDSPPAIRFSCAPT